MFIYVNLKLCEGPRKRANRGGDPNLDLIQGDAHGGLESNVQESDPQGKQF